MRLNSTFRLLDKSQIMASSGHGQTFVACHIDGMVSACALAALSLTRCYKLDLKAIGYDINQFPQHLNATGQNPCKRAWLALGDRPTGWSEIEDRRRDGPA
jgi:hypothetical protein